ncbi:unnamed protein product [Rangifer tarandus platyrhynchus]|uniref:Uncharacterized protein n=1 Tax=Rangifer tarandus platyrhynchus TaxID=3082113 RepID=A0AC59YHA0_RANTA
MLGCGDTATERAGVAPASWHLELRRAGVHTLNEPRRSGDVLTPSGRGLNEDAKCREDGNVSEIRASRISAGHLAFRVLFSLPSSWHPLGGGGGSPQGAGVTPMRPRQKVPTWGVGSAAEPPQPHPPSFWGSREVAGLGAAGEGRAAVALCSAACRAD